MAVLRNGLFEAREQQDLLYVILQEQDKEKKKEDICEEDRLWKRAQAVAARRKVKGARKLATEIGSHDVRLLDPRQVKLLQLLDNGSLEADMKAKNKAYEHGEGANVTTKEQAATFRMSCLWLDRMRSTMGIDD